MRNYTNEELAADYKFRGIPRQSAYSQFVRDRNLNPGIDAREFFKIYDAAYPQKINREIHSQRVEGMTHILKETYCPDKRSIKLLEEKEHYIRWIAENGMTGSTPKQYIESISVI